MHANIFGKPIDDMLGKHRRSQFFLTFRPTEHLDVQHTVFSRVIEGFDVLPKITRTEGPQARPTQDKIISAEILRKRDHAYEPKHQKRASIGFSLGRSMRTSC